jgi:alkyl sulfatase BDS1-like metallo-beta-lactamase superfamily hydrolase
MIKYVLFFCFLVSCYCNTYKLCENFVIDTTESYCIFNEAFFNNGNGNGNEYLKFVCEQQTEEDDCKGNNFCVWVDTKNQNDLSVHNSIWDPPRVIQVTDNIFVATGYALANSAMIIGDDGVVIVDTTDSVVAASVIINEFSQYNDFSEKPVKAIIYTHSHTDHWVGSLAYTQIGLVPFNPFLGTTPFQQGSTPVIAHKSFVPNLQRLRSVFDNVVPRSVKQFGVNLTNSDTGRVSAGIGPCLAIEEIVTASAVLIVPWITFEDEFNYSVSGLDLELFFVPGETDDQIAVYINASNTLISGDNVYKAFPNIYAIRGTPNRDVLKWVNSIDVLESYNADNFVPMHTLPIINDSVKISSILSSYKDGIKYIHDQTVQQMNLGKTPSEIANNLELPANLASEPYLQEFYGTIEHSVRAIYGYYVGWFDGQVKNLYPLSETEESRRLVELGGGKNKILKLVDDLLGENTFESYQWALQLLESLRTNELPNVDTKVEELYVFTLKLMGFHQISANSRNYYLSVAFDAEQQLNDNQNQNKKKRSIDSSEDIGIIKIFMNNLQTKFNTKKYLGLKNANILIQFTDIENLQVEENLHYEILIKKSVCYVKSRPDLFGSLNKKPKLKSLSIEKEKDTFDLEITTDTKTFKSLIYNPSKLTEVVANKHLIYSYNNEVISLHGFFDLFN